MKDIRYENWGYPVSRRLFQFETYETFWVGVVNHRELLVVFEESPDPHDVAQILPKWIQLG